MIVGGFCEMNPASLPMLSASIHRDFFPVDGRTKHRRSHPVPLRRHKSRDQSLPPGGEARAVSGNYLPLVMAQLLIL